MGVRVKIETDELKPFGEVPKNLRSIYVEDDGSGWQSIQIRPYVGSVEIRTCGNAVTIDAFAIPALIRALRAAAKEIG